MPPPAGACPFCGVATEVPHETQERCIAALHEEIRRVRNILASLKPTGVPETPSDDNAPKAVRISLTDPERL